MSTAHRYLAEHRDGPRLRLARSRALSLQMWMQRGILVEADDLASHLGEAQDRIVLAFEDGGDSPDDVLVTIYGRERTKGDCRVSVGRPE
jgi:hypothetical protein